MAAEAALVQPPARLHPRPLPLGLAGPLYNVAAAFLGTGLSAYALAGLSNAGAAHRWARNFFLLTLAYLTLLFAALLVSAR